MGYRGLQNVAASLASDLHITVTDLGVNDSDDTLQELLTSRGGEIMTRMRYMRSETLGRIIAGSVVLDKDRVMSELATLARVSEQERRPLKGRDILIMLASIVIARQMTIVLAHVRED